MSSLSRAFTTRKYKVSLDMGDLSKSPHRSNSTREHRGPILRHKISAPIQLVHTTNMLSYNAPDIPRRAGSSPSVKSDADSEAHSTTESTPPTSPDVGPTEDCPSPEPNHLSTYFMAPDKVHASPNAHKADPPVIPQRSPSHTKKNSYDAIARQRSISRMSKDSEHTLTSKASFTFSRSSSTSTRASSVSSTSTGQVQKPAPPPVSSPAPPTSFQQRSYTKEFNPFGQELAQVTELAEEYGAKSNSKMEEEDGDYMKSHSLAKFTADDYLSEISDIFTNFFNDATTHVRTPAPLWI
ncbi:Fc.00g066380.m01.CDS01 [Cosmosporella sp. VM-42]